MLCWLLWFFYIYAIWYPCQAAELLCILLWKLVAGIHLVAMDISAMVSMVVVAMVTLLPGDTGEAGAGSSSTGRALAVRSSGGGGGRSSSSRSKIIYIVLQFCM